MDKINNKLAKYQFKLLNSFEDNKREIYNAKLNKYIEKQNNLFPMTGGANDDNPFASFLENMAQYQPKEKSDTEIDKNIKNIQINLNKTHDLDNIYDTLIDYYVSLLNKDVFDSFKPELKLLHKDILHRLSNKISDNYVKDKIKEL